MSRHGTRDTGHGTRDSGLARRAAVLSLGVSYTQEEEVDLVCGDKKEIRSFADKLMPCCIYDIVNSCTLEQQTPSRRLSALRRHDT